MVRWGGVLGRVLDDILDNVNARVARWVKAELRRTDTAYALATLAESGLIRCLGRGSFEVLGIEDDSTSEPGSGDSEV